MGCMSSIRSFQIESFEHVTSVMTDKWQMVNSNQRIIGWIYYCNRKSNFNIEDHETEGIAINCKMIISSRYRIHRNSKCIYTNNKHTSHKEQRLSEQVNKQTQN